MLLPLTSLASATNPSPAATSIAAAVKGLTGILAGDAGETLDRSGGVGLQRAVIQLVVEPALEDRALRSIERGAEILVVLDLRDQIGGGLLLAIRDRRQMRIDGVGLGQERGPEICLRLVVLESRDGAGETTRHFGKSAGMARIAIAACRRVQAGVALDDVDNVEQIVAGAAQRSLI